MKFEFILKVRDRELSPLYTKYRCVVPEERFDFVLKEYESHKPKDVFDSIILVNKLDDEGNFLEIVQ